MTASDLAEIPSAVNGWVDQTRYREEASFPVEQGYIWTSCASVENGNPLFWDPQVAEDLTNGPVAPPTTLSLWFRPHYWEPDQAAPRNPLQVHFDLKDALGLPEAVMTDSRMVFHDPVRPGDLIATEQVLRSVSPPKTTKLGTGRFWVIDVDYRNQHGDLVGTEIFTGFGYRRAERSEAESVPSQAVPSGSGAAGRDEAPAPPSAPVDRDVGTGTDVAGAEPGAPDRLLTATEVAAGDRLPTLTYPVSATTVVLGALATRDWRPMHHDVDFAVNRNGVRDIFLNTPNQQAWFERYATDWTGPRGRLGRMRFRMRDSVYPGDTMRLDGQVDRTFTDDTGCTWAELTVTLSAQDTRDEPADATPAPRRTATTCTLQVALPADTADNPWGRRGEAWRPDLISGQAPAPRSTSHRSPHA